MKARCKNPSHGRGNYLGITYCERWESFVNFFADMGVRPSGTSLDRIDPNGNYEPGNCRWADIITQENNRRNNVYYLVDGERLTLPQIARKYGISRSNLADKIYLKKWGMNEAIDYLLERRR